MTGWISKRGLAAFSVTLFIGLSVAAEPQSVTVTGVAEVFDGDTLDIGPVRIRLHGIDAPESGQS